MNSESKIQEEKVLQAKSGFVMLICGMLLTLVGIAGFGYGIYLIDQSAGGAAAGISVVLGTILFVAGVLVLCGLKVINPKEALVLALFGNYYGTLRKEGFFWVNPFVTAINPTVRIAANGKGVSRKVSLKTMTLNNEKQKVNDELGNPVEIGAVVIWKVENPTKAVINVENYKSYLSIQCDSIIRNTARKYPYDGAEGGDEKSLRSSSQEIANIMCEELQEKVENAGIKIQDVRITHLAYPLIFNPWLLPEIGIGNPVKMVLIKHRFSGHRQHVHNRMKIVDEQDASGLQAEGHFLKEFVQILKPCDGSDCKQDRKSVV